MTLPEILEHEAAFADEVQRQYVDPTNNSRPILDGVVCPEEYLAANPKILWVLKEPWDEEDRKGGGWSLTKDILLPRFSEQGRNRTFAPIAYVGHGISSGETWANMPDIRDHPGMLRQLLKIAFINVSKLPGLKQSSNSEIWRAYRKWGDIIHRQIDSYQPDLIFGCNPHLPAIAAHFGVTKEDWKNLGHVWFAKTPPRTFFTVWHPSQRRSRERWVDDILAAVKAAA